MTSERAQRTRIACAALQLRKSVLAYLGSREANASREPLLAASTEAWTFLVRVECCAIPLVARLREDGILERLDGASRARLLAAEEVELQRVLAARLLVRELDAIGERDGVRLTLLKGGALAADPARQPLDLGDVDVLATRDDAKRVWRSLLANGWSPVASGLTPTDELGAREHYAPLRSERHELPLELHARFDYGLSPVGAERAPATTPIPGYRSIDRLAEPRAVAVTLRHSVVAHPHRRGHLRDLFLLSELLRELDDGEVDMLERNLQGDAQRVELLAMLAQSRALSRGEPLADPDVLRPFVCFKYAAAAATSRLLGTSSAVWNVASHVVLERPVVRRAAYRRLLRGATEPVPRDWSASRHPVLRSRLARSVGLPRLVRAARRAALVLTLIAVGGAIRRHVEQLNFGAGGG